jgi:hypothetical protein
MPVGWAAAPTVRNRRESGHIGRIGRGIASTTRRTRSSTMPRRSLLLVVLTAALVTAVPALAGDRAVAARPGEHGPVVRFGGAACRLVGVPKVAVPTASAVQVGGTCPGIRPGGVVISDIGLCTLNFVFRGSDGARYIGTAGHCILEGTGIAERAWARGKGPVAKDRNGRRFGEFSYAAFKDPKDFALIRIDDGVAASPEMCHFGGPVGLNATPTAAGGLLEHYGNGVGIGDYVPGRTSVALSLGDANQVTAIGAVVPGDSGSGVLDQSGRAVGVIVTTGISVGPPAYIGTVGITRLAPQLRRATDVTRVQYALQTAPRR